MKKICKMLSGCFVVAVLMWVLQVPVAAETLTCADIKAAVPTADEVIPYMVNEFVDQGDSKIEILRETYSPVSQDYYRFRRNQVYTYEATVRPKSENDVFETGTTFTVNGQEAEILTLANKEATVRYTFPSTEAQGRYTLLERLDLFMIAPEIGEEAGTLKILFPETALYTEETAPSQNFWFRYDEAAGEYRESNDFIHTIIRPESKYHCEIIIDLKPGYIMDENTIVYINGGATTTYLPPYNDADAYSARFFFETGKAENLHGANVKVDPPQLGESLARHQAYTEEKGYKILETRWSPKQFAEFQPDTIYTVQVDLEATNYTHLFDVGEGVFTINGQPAKVIRNVGEFVILEYTFPTKAFGLVTLNGHQAYIKDNGQYAKNEFVRFEGSIYYFDEDGYMVTNGFKAIGKIWYYFDESGDMAVGFKAVDKIWYYFDEFGQMQKGWQQIDGTYYYFNGSGAMLKGWQKIGANWFYFNGSGHMVTGWQAIGGKWYYFYSSGRMLTGWQQIDGKWYYLKPSGEMTKGWLKDGRNWFYFNGSGHMVTGWQVIGGKWYYFYGSGRMVTGWQQIGGKWYYLKPSGEMTKGWLKDGRNWFYFNGSGHMVTGKQQIGGKWYTFGSNGALR